MTITAWHQDRQLMWKANGEKYRNFHSTLIIAILLVMPPNTIVLGIKANDQSVIIGPSQHITNNILREARILSTSTVRPWPSDKFFRKVLSQPKWVDVQANYRHQSQDKNPPETEPKNLRSHNHSSHAMPPTNSSLEYKLSFNKQKQLIQTDTRHKTGLSHHIYDLKNKIQSKNTNTQYHVTKRRPEANIVRVNRTRVQMHNSNNAAVLAEDSVGVSKSSFKSQSKNLGSGGSFLEDDEVDVIQPFGPPSFSQTSPNDVPYHINRNNYGFGFQFEMAPMNAHGGVTQRPKIVTSTQRASSSEMITKISSTTHEQILAHHLIANERSDPWKRIPTLTVTVSPINNDAYTSSTNLKLVRKKPQTPTHVHYPYPFSTEIKTTPTSQMSTSFDFPMSPTFNSGLENHTPAFSSGSYITPLRPTFSPPHVTTVVPQHVHIRPNFEHTSLPSGIIKQQQEVAGLQASVGSSLSLNRPFTNIWYKPIINHFVSSITKPPNASDTNTNNNQYVGGLIFKVWSYKNGKLTLVNENVIPAEAVEGFQLENGSILNLEQIPHSVQQTVAAAISQLNHNDHIHGVGEDSPGYNFNFEPTLKISSEHGHLIQSQIGSIHSEKSAPEKQLETSKNDKTFVNYVIMDKKNFPTFDEIINVRPTLKIASAEVDHDNFPQMNQHYISFLDSSTTYRPQIAENQDDFQDQWVDPLWQQLHSLLLSVADVQLPTPVQRDPYPRDPASTPVPPKLSSYSETDSFQSEKIQDPQLLADMAALAILISYLKNQTTVPQEIDEPVTVTAPTIAPNAPEIYQYLLQQVLHMGNLTHRNSQESDPPKKSLTLSILSTTSQPPKDKSLLLKGSVKKGVKKKLKKKLKKKKKKIKHSFLDKFNIIKDPKKYWFDVKFDVDIYDIMKKKFLYLLAYKYMPVVLIVVLKLVPLALVIIPILLKILWFKKHPKYVKVPVHIPVPKPYPVYKYIKYKHPRYPYHHYNSPNIEENLVPPPFHDDNVPHTYPKAPLPPQHPIDIQNEENRLNLHSKPKPHPQAVTHAYELGFDLGSKLSSMTNNHDREVLKILIESRKNKIKKLLKGWDLIHKGKSTTPIQRLGYFVNTQKQKKVKVKEEDNGIPVDQQKEKQLDKLITNYKEKKRKR